jgi:putative endonuclease
MDHIYYVYILTNKPYGTLYIGVTNDLKRRVLEHRSGKGSEFTHTHNVHRLVYYEHTNDVMVALSREKKLKNWHRDWKIDLIVNNNPKWEDISGISMDPESSSG